MHSTAPQRFHHEHHELHELQPYASDRLTDKAHCGSHWLAKPSQAKPNQTKPSQTKPSQAKLGTWCSQRVIHRRLVFAGAKYLQHSYAQCANLPRYTIY
jgi:hypothetical protein